MQTRSAHTEEVLYPLLTQGAQPISTILRPSHCQTSQSREESMTLDRLSSPISPLEIRKGRRRIAGAFNLEVRWSVERRLVVMASVGKKSSHL